FQTDLSKTSPSVLRLVLVAWRASRKVHIKASLAQYGILRVINGADAILMGFVWGDKNSAAAVRLANAQEGLSPEWRALGGIGFESCLDQSAGQLRLQDHCHFPYFGFFGGRAEARQALWPSLRLSVTGQ